MIDKINNGKLTVLTNDKINHFFPPRKNKIRIGGCTEIVNHEHE